MIYLEKYMKKHSKSVDLTKAPLNTKYGRMDEVTSARNPRLKYGISKIYYIESDSFDPYYNLALEEKLLDICKEKI